jgi:hypothetical protein
MKDKSKPIPLEEFSDESESLFIVEVKSKELTEPIKVINKILDSKDHGGAKDLHSFAAVFAEALMQYGSKMDFVHAETILRGFIRRKSNILKFPDWSHYGDHNDYYIVRLKEGLFNNPSALISLSYGDMRRQLIKPDLYKKTAPSHLDALFVRDLTRYTD